MTPVPAIFLEHLHAVSERDAVAIEEIWDGAGIIEFPYAVSTGGPSRLEGRAQIIEYFTALELFGPFHFDPVEAWSTGQRAWIVEMHGSSTLLSSGRPYEQDYVSRFATDERGMLIWMREYWDPTRIS